MIDKLDFIWIERAVDINVKPLYVNKKNLNITFDKGFNINLDNKNETEKIKDNLDSFSFINTGFTIKGNNNSEDDLLKSNYIPNHKNKLLNYLPKLKSQSVQKEKCSYQLNDFLNKVDKNYNTIKEYLIQLNPILKNNPSLKKQFFLNISEGKQEKYIFYRNLYELINNLNYQNKLNVKKEFQSKRFLKNNINLEIKNPPIPKSTLFNILIKDMKNKYKYPFYEYDNKSKKIFKSFSQNNIIKNKI